MKTLVIGAGVIGITTAYELQRAGYKVTVIDAENGPALGATDANGGILTPSMSDPWNAPGVWKDLFRWLGREDAPMLLRLRALPGLIPWGLRFLRAANADHFRRSLRLNAELATYSLHCLNEIHQRQFFDYASAQAGTIKVYRNQSAMEVGLAKTSELADYGVECQQCSARQVVELEPALAPLADQLAGGLYFPGDQSGHAAAFTQELCKVNRELGVECLWNTRVASLVVEGGRIKGVEVSAGSRQGDEGGQVIAADVVVVAGGSESDVLATAAGTRLPVKPVKGYSITVPISRGLSSHPLPSIPIVDDDLHAAVTPLGDQIRIAGTAEFTGFNRELEPGRIDNLKTLTRQILPLHAEQLLAGDCQPRFGFRPMCADGIPVIGATRVKGLFINCGHGHLGWTQAAGSAKLMLGLISGTDTELAMAAFSPQRWS